MIYLRNSIKWSIIVIILLAIITGCQNAGKVEQGNWTKVSLNQSELKKMQEEVQEGHRPGLRDPIQVAHEFLENYLNLKGKRSQPIQTLDDGKKIITFNLDNGKMIELRLIQPLGNDKRGIWAVEAYRYIN